MSSPSVWALISMRLGPSDSPKQTSLVEPLPCWMVEAWQSQRKQRSMDWEQERRGVLSIFLRGWAAATVGSLLGKISAALWSAAEPAITINERKRPVRAQRRKRQSQTKNKRWRKGERKRGQEGNDIWGSESETKRQIKSTPIRNGRDSAGKS